VRGEGTAEQAFDELRAEVTVMRRAVEELKDAVGELPLHDYGESLAAVVETQRLLAAARDARWAAAGARLAEVQRRHVLVAFAVGIAAGLLAVPTIVGPALDALAESWTAAGGAGRGAAATGPVR
jgi:hypothetical protein